MKKTKLVLKAQTIAVLADSKLVAVAAGLDTTRSVVDMCIVRSAKACSDRCTA